MIWSFVGMIVIFGLLGFLRSLFSSRKSQDERIVQEEERAKSNYWWGG
jgi:hypothetical protein